MLLTLLGLDGMGLDVMMSFIKVFTIPYKTTRAMHLSKPPKVNTEQRTATVYIYVITTCSLVRG